MSATAAASQFYAANPAAQQADMAALQSLLSRSATDVEFRQKLLTDPRAAVSEFTGRQMPESFDVTFIEKSGDVTFVLPPAIDPATELSDSDLESVAGGVTIFLVVGFTVGAGAYLMMHDAAKEG